MVTLDQAGAGIPTVRLLEPPRDLRNRLEYLWTESPLHAPHPGHPAWRLVPDACAHVLYHRLTPRSSGGGIRHRLVVAGPRSAALDIDKTRRALTVGVRLRPWAVEPLLGVPGRDLADATAHLQDVIGAGGTAEVEERLREADPGETPRVLVEWLLRRAPGFERTEEGRVRRTVERLRRDGSCERAARSAGVGTRRLRSWIRERIGLSPKVLARVLRLHDALDRAAAPGRAVPWSRIAVESGYYDQAHMIREFRSFLGETPGTWRARRVHARCRADMA